MVPVLQLTDCSVEVDVRGLEEATNAKYWITFFVFSVFPAPLSPLSQQVAQLHANISTAKDSRAKN